VIERENKRLADEGLILQAAAASVVGGEEGIKAFNQVIERLRD